MILIEPGSIAEELGIPVGSRLLEINGRPILDRLDYWFLSSADELSLVMAEGDEEVEYIIEKDYDESLGLVFPDSLMDAAKHCHNHCVFCFIDQLPEGLRQTLYFKDDDSRLSFLQGNFVTLTNLTQTDLQRIVDYGIHPINVSIHSLDPLVRRRMLGNPRSLEIKSQLDFLAQKQVRMNGQIVLVPGYNDGPDLEQTLEELMDYHPMLQSVGIVPVGLTKFRDKLPRITGFTPKAAGQIIQRVARFQERARDRLGTRLAFLADEFYLLADQALPPADDYEGFLQHENGIGMVRRFIDELEGVRPSGPLSPRHFVTGTAFYPILKSLVDQLNIQYNETWKVSAVTNRFLGETITVAGLVTARDLIDQVVVEQGETLFVCETMFNTDGLTLDDYSKADIEQAMNTRIEVVANHGQELLKELSC
ncbi:MAG TPA: DUF512 domain-containing protein [Tissierellia bacterium]|nr:DUF512 domain-containing protein [Tissierellia bacterium]